MCNGEYNYFFIKCVFGPIKELGCKLSKKTRIISIVNLTFNDLLILLSVDSR